MPYMKWIGWPIFIVFTCFLIGLYIYDQTLETGNIESKSPSLNSSLTIKQEILENFPEVTTHYENRKSEDEEESYEWPTFPSEDTNDKISNWINEQKSVGSKAIKLTKGENAGEHYYQFMLEAEVNEGKEILPFVVDRENTQLLSLDDLFTLDEKFIDQVESILEKEGKHDSDIQETFSNIDEIKSLSWLVDEESLTFYLEDQLQSSNLADLEIELPLASFLAFAKDDFINKNELLAGIVAEEKARKEEEERKKREEEERKRQEEESQKANGNSNVGKYIALTFDDGPHPEVTPRVLNILSEYGAKATFFMLGTEVRKYPNIVQRMVNEGHELANHTHNHLDLTKQNYGTVEEQLVSPRNAIREVTGVDTTLFRPPYGAVNDNVISVAGNAGNSIILWSVDSLDWQSRNADAIYNRVMNDVRAGSIVLMHDLYPTTADALERILSSLSAEGYKFVSVSELLKIGGKGGTGPHNGI